MCDNISGSSKAPLSSLMITWALLVPLVFLAIHGQPWFLGPNTNMFVPIGAGALAGQRTAAESVFEQSVKIVIMALFYGLAISRSRAVNRALTQNRILVLVIFWALGSSVWSQFPVTTLQFSTILISNFAFAAFLAVRFDPERQMRLFAGLGAVVAVCTVFAVVFIPGQGIDLKEGGTTAWQGIFNHKNDCAIALSYLLTPFFFSSHLRRHLSWTRRAGIVLLLFVIVMSESRTGWIMAATFFAYLATVRLNTKFDLRSRRILYTIVAAGIAVALAFLFLNASEFFQAIGKSSNATGRTIVWLTALKSIWKHPFLGYGYHAFFMGMQGESANTASILRTGVPLMHAQSGFLDVWLDLGIVGLLLVCYTLWKALKNGVHCVVNSNSASAQWYLSIVILTVVANIGERNLMCCNFLDWILYLVAYIGLDREAKALSSNRPKLLKIAKAVNRRCAA